MATTELILPDGAVAEIESDDYDVDVEGLGNITAHANKADSRLIERFRRPVYRAIVSAVAEEITTAENMLWNVLLSRYIDDASGKSLDMLGARVGESRNSQDDPDYRVRIRARILINRSRGGPEDLYSICRMLGVTSVIRNTGNASLRIDLLTYSANPAIRTQIAGLLGEATSAGVGLHVSAPASTDISAIWDSVNGDPGGALYGSVSSPSAGSGVLGHSRQV